jgi:hypothetical protein
MSVRTFMAKKFNTTGLGSDEKFFLSDRWKVIAGNSYRRGKLSTVDLLIEIACFEKKAKKYFQHKSS